MTKEKQIDTGSDEGVKSQVDIREGHRFIADQFLQFYTERGYRALPSASLLPQNDQSVLFTGATITPLKKFLEESVPTPGLCIVQKCLRTKHLDEITDLDKIPDWTHYFTMCGILSNPDQLREVPQDAYELLINRLKIQKGNLLIEASSDDVDLSGPWSSRGIDVVEDTHPRSYYQWRYGLPDISGRGINILLRSNEADSYRDLGNVISVEDNTSNVVAYEFGFGLESLLSKIYGFKRPQEASLVSSVISYKEGLQEKFIDIMMAAVVIYHQGVEPGRGKEKNVLKKLVKGLSYLRRQMDLSIEQIEDWSEKFEEIEFGSCNSRDKLITGIRAYESQLAKFTDYAKNQVHAHQLRNDMGERLSEKLRTEATNMGILLPEVDSIINGVL